MENIPNIIFNQRRSRTTLQFQVALEGTNQYKTIDQSKVPLGFGYKTQMRYLYKTIANGCAYACAPHLLQ